MAQLVVHPRSLKRVLPLAPAQAEALGDPIRVAILEELSDEPASVEELTKALRGRGIRKAPTTVRHHLHLLKSAGLVDLVRAEETRGAVLKYYAANTRILHYDLPGGFEERFAPAISAGEQEARRALRKLLAVQGRELRETAESLKACPYCPTEHFLEYLLLKVLERGVAKALEDGTLIRSRRAERSGRGRPS